MTEGVLIRRSRPGDGPALARLAALDSSHELEGPALIAEVEGETLAALSLSDRTAVADPFSPTADLLDLLRLRAAQLGTPDGGPPSPRPGRLRRPVRSAPERAPAAA